MVWESCNKQISALRSAPWLYSVLSASSANLQLRIWLSCRHQTDMILRLQQPGWASFRRTSLWIPLTFFFQLLSRNTGTLPPSLQCFSIPAPKEPILSLLSLCWLCGCFTLLDQRSSQFCVINEKAFGHPNLTIYSWHFLPLSFFSVHNGIRGESVKYCINCTVQIEHL